MSWTRLLAAGLFSGAWLLGCGGSDTTSAGGGGTGTGASGGASTGGAGGETTTSTAGGAGGQGGSGGSGGVGGQGGSGGAAGALTLLTLNLHCFQLGGTSYASNGERFAAIVDFAAARGVDVLTVQEACQRPGEDAIGTLAEGLTQATGQPWSSVWNFAHVAWEGTPDQADEGVGLLIRGEGSDPVLGEHAMQSALRRVLVSARLPASLGGTRVMSIHFDVFDAPARAGQAREAAADAIVRADPGFDAIVAGDFNDVEGSPAWSAFPAMGYLPADQGLSATGIDHVMIHRAAPLRPVKVEEVLTGMQAVSDHPGVLVRFEAAAGDPVTATRISTAFDPGPGHFLSVRGSAPPLSWDYGSPMPVVGAGRSLILTEMQGDFDLKLLRDDKDWQQGANVPASAGGQIVVTPVF